MIKGMIKDKTKDDGKNKVYSKDAWKMDK